jgi:multidrug resistance efflux pump
MILRQSDTIPTPWIQRLHHVRQSLLPVICFCGCVLTALWMWDRQGQFPNAVGEVQAVRIDVTASADGILTTLPCGPWTLFDRVEAETVLAQLDDRAVRAEMATLQAELVRLRSELVAAAEQIELDEAGRVHDYQREARRLAWQVQQHRLDLLDRGTLIETDRAAKTRLETELGFLEPLRARGTVSELQVTDQRLQRDIVSKRISESERSLAEAHEQLDAVTAAVHAYPTSKEASVDKLLGPLEAAITVGQRRLDEYQVQLESLQIRAPFRGTICAIQGWPGQQIRAGDLIVTLAAEEGRYIVSYVRQEQRIRPAVGMPVAVRLRGSRTLPVGSVIERVGPQVELVPLHHLRDPKTQEWGQPVCIQPPQQLDLRPGELIDVTFQRTGGRSSL